MEADLKKERAEGNECLVRGGESSAVERRLAVAGLAGINVTLSGRVERRLSRCPMDMTMTTDDAAGSCRPCNLDDGACARAVHEVAVEVQPSILVPLETVLDDLTAASFRQLGLDLCCAVVWSAMGPAQLRARSEDRALLAALAGWLAPPGVLVAGTAAGRAFTAVAVSSTPHPVAAGGSEWMDQRASMAVTVIACALGLITVVLGLVIYRQRHHRLTPAPPPFTSKPAPIGGFGAFAQQSVPNPAYQEDDPGDGFWNLSDAEPPNAAEYLDIRCAPTSFPPPDLPSDYMALE